jgi:hypothetical protein
MSTAVGHILMETKGWTMQGTKWVMSRKSLFILYFW